jgi:hypothetical protein
MEIIERRARTTTGHAAALPVGGVALIRGIVPNTRAGRSRTSRRTETPDNSGVANQHEAPAAWAAGPRARWRGHVHVGAISGPASKEPSIQFGSFRTSYNKT